MTAFFSQKILKYKFINQSGRSMVEMLGVLAIIGVLSIGAMAGYSKAMYKHKLNNQINTYNQIIAFVHENYDKFSDLANGTELQTYMYKLGVIPKEWMNKDAFNNRYFVRRINNAFDMSVMLSSETDDGYITAGSNFTICQDMFSHLMVPNSYSISSAGIILGIGGTEEGSEWVNEYYGDRTCNRKTKKCLSEVTMAEIAADCDACRVQRACRLHFIFDFQTKRLTK